MILRKIFTAILLGLAFNIPVNVESKNNDVFVYVGGETIGFKNIEGLEITGIYEIDGMSPASSAGLKVNDVILKINDNEVHTREDLFTAIKDNYYEDLNISYNRDGNIYETKLTPIVKNNKVSLGIYVKEESLGMGTLTYVHPETLRFGALGHNFTQNSGPCNGTINEVELQSIIKSKSGFTGEKQGKFMTKVYGKLLLDDRVGIFGKLNNLDVLTKKKLYKVASQKDISLGTAYVYLNISGNVVEKYQIEILEINKQLSKDTKGIKFRVVDQNLIKATGGIIKGMSGSPIVQNEFIIGAVSHVVLNDPNIGYATHIGFMLENSNTL